MDEMKLKDSGRGVDVMAKKDVAASVAATGLKSNRGSSKLVVLDNKMIRKKKVNRVKINVYDLITSEAIVSLPWGAIFPLEGV
mmetsp:Transcript_42534/g.51841  ORF Transcript_42534/g.51841 Transcript_42534/m.51841 type:complete len:83 (+) Transcript_42534:1285-1533(+)